MEDEEQKRNQRLLGWLQKLIVERISSELEVVISGQGTKTYRLMKDSKRIEMPAWTWPPGDAVTNSDWYVPGSEGFSSLVEERLPAPGVNSVPKPLVEESRRGYIVHYDILGMVCWVLSRAEEIGRTDLDEHSRFPATSSHAYRHGYLDRPLVDEWLDFLKQLVIRLWPGMDVVKPAFEVRLTHDVDQPSAFGFGSAPQMCQSILGDILKRRDIVTALRRPWIWHRSRQSLQASDPYNTFDWLMDASERCGVRSVFYFVCGRTDATHDPKYEVAHPAIRELLRKIHSRGHEIGLHPSYGTFRAPELLRSEAQRLFAICEQEGITQEKWGARMHYLRWVTPDTLYGLQNAQLDYDSTVGYADTPGFRCGTSREYDAFDPIDWQPLRLRILPLIAMDCTVLDPSYMDVGATESAAEIFIALKENCRKAGGQFTLLWHNSQLRRSGERDVYEAVLER